jgi:hypothetical protein
MTAVSWGCGAIVAENRAEVRGAATPLIGVGIWAHFRQENSASCNLVAHAWNRYGVQNQETKDHPDIYVCRGLRRPWREFSKDFRYFG